MGHDQVEGWCQEPDLCQEMMTGAEAPWEGHPARQACFVPLQQLPPPGVDPLASAAKQHHQGMGAARVVVDRKPDGWWLCLVWATSDPQTGSHPGALSLPGLGRHCPSPLGQHPPHRPVRQIACENGKCLLSCHPLYGVAMPGELRLVRVHAARPYEHGPNIYLQQTTKVIARKLVDICQRMTTFSNFSLGAGSLPVLHAWQISTAQFKIN